MNKAVGIGACVMDTLINVPNYPKEDTKMRAESSKQAGGGPVATGLVAAAQLGAEADYIDDTNITLNPDNIEVLSGYRSFSSVIWLSAKASSRTCVFDKGNLPPLKLNDEQKKAIIDADLLMIDGNEMSGALEAVKIARENGTKVLYDAGGLYDNVECLLPYADILIPSEEFALGITGEKKAENAAKKLYEKYNPDVVVITQGKNGGTLYDGTRLTAYPAFSVKVADSNGAGDVFHGAFAAGYLKGYDFLKCCYFASGVSAVKCTGVGARESVPDFETVKKFWEENGYEL